MIGMVDDIVAGFRMHQHFRLFQRSEMPTLRGTDFLDFQLSDHALPH